MSNLHESAGGHFIVIDLGVVALALSGKLSPEERTQILGVGSSGIEFARRILPDAPSIAVSTIEFDRDRAKRQLAVVNEVQPTDGTRWFLVDDVAVSGRTVEVVRQALNGAPQSIGVGLLYDSRKTRARIGVQDIRFGVLYSREGGGTPPMNSVSTLQMVPERLADLVTRYFAARSEEFICVMNGQNR